MKTQKRDHKNPKYTKKKNNDDGELLIHTPGIHYLLTITSLSLPPPLLLILCWPSHLLNAIIPQQPQPRKSHAHPPQPIRINILDAPQRFPRDEAPLAAFARLASARLCRLRRRVQGGSRQHLRRGVLEPHRVRGGTVELVKIETLLPMHVVRKDFVPLSLFINPSKTTPGEIGRTDLVEFRLVIPRVYRLVVVARITQDLAAVDLDGREHQRAIRVHRVLAMLPLQDRGRTAWFCSCTQSALTLVSWGKWGTHGSTRQCTAPPRSIRRT
jgi:hypothetical protein